MTQTAPLDRHIQLELDKPAPEEAHRIVSEIVAAGDGHVRAVLFYGSCRRLGAAEGILDFYVIVDSYRGFHGSASRAFWNWLVPPTVTFHQAACGPERGWVVSPSAAKIAFVSERAFARLMRRRSLNCSLWARFSQPVSLLYVADVRARESVVAVLATACRTAVFWGRRVAPNADSGREFWSALFAYTYGTELRPEGPERAGVIFDHDPDWYNGVLGALDIRLLRQEANQARLNAWTILRVRTALRGRQVAGKGLAFARLVKGAFTFAGGVDYVIWKIERHSGRQITLTPWQRRHPILSAPAILVKLYRLGAIR